MQSTAHKILEVKDIEEAYLRVKPVVHHTPLQLNHYLSEKYNCKVYLKREDLQIVRSYKLRGAYNKISRLSKSQLINGVVCASAGNHAQGVAYVCEKLNINGVLHAQPNTKSEDSKGQTIWEKFH